MNTDIEQKLHRHFLRELRRNHNLEELANTILTQMIAIVPGAQCGACLILDDGERVFAFRAAIGWDMAKLSHIKIPQDWILQQTLYCDEPTIIRDPFQSGSQVAIWVTEFRSVKAILALPIICAGKTIAYITLGNDEDADAFSSADLIRLREIDEGITLALWAVWERDRLAESAAKYRSLLESLTAAVLSIDEEGRISFWSKGAEKLFGYTAEEIEGKPVALVESRDELRGIFTDLSAAVEKSEQHSRGEGVRKDGTRFPIQWSCSIGEQGGRPVLVAMGRDLTGQVQVEQTLLASEERFKIFFKRLADAVFITALGGEILEANTAASQQTGYSYAELIGMNIMTEIAAEEPAVTYEKVQHKLIRGETVFFEEKKRRKDGTIYYTDCAVTPIEYKGELATLSVNRDITEHKETETKLEHIYQLACELSQATERQQVCDLAVQCGYDFLRADFCSVYLLDTDNKTLSLVAEHGFAGYRGFTYDLTTDKALVVTVANSGESIYVADVTSEPRYDLWAAEVKSGLYIPIKVIGKILGVYEVESTVLDNFTSADIRLFTALAAQIAIAIQSIEKREKVEESEAAYHQLNIQLEGLHKVVGQLMGCHTREEVYKTVIAAAESILKFSICTIDIANGDYLVPQMTSQGMPEGASIGFPITNGLGGKTYQTKQTYLFGDIKEIPEAKPTRTEFRSGISTPVGDVGVFQVVSTEYNAFTDKDVRLTELLANHAAAALQRIQLEEELREQAIRDPLTGLYNRRYLDDVLEKEISRARRYNRDFALVMIDLDNFKKVNDYYGHQRGDQVLKEIAALIQADLRESDYLFRYGGDEFLLVLPETNGKAQQVIDRIHRAVTEWKKEAGLERAQLGLTIGLAVRYPGDEKSCDDLLREADAMLYRHKKTKNLLDS
ncbi:diguanylate cyclase [Candidatus Acetothermia bacterium]|nr:diguanylate cyclase [Candidatus Acetothermia bacterium]